MALLNTIKFRRYFFLSLLIFACLLAGAFIALWQMDRDKKRGGLPARTQAADLLNMQAEIWLNNLKKKDVKATLTIARKIVGKVKIKNDALGNYQRLFLKVGIKPQFLTDQFNYWDYMQWEHALFFKQKAKAIIKNQLDPLKALTEAVHGQIKPFESNKNEVMLPYFIWQRGYGVCDRQCWVLCELALQLGYDTRIVWLINPENGLSPHTICEIRKPGFSAVADPYKNIYLPDMDIATLANNLELLKKIWPEQPLWWTAIRGAKLMIPASAQDYCPRNQQLYKIIHKTLGVKCPRFGADPKVRMEYFDSLVDDSEKKYNSFPRGLYGYPLVCFRNLLVLKQKSKKE